MRWFWRRKAGEDLETLRAVMQTFAIDAVKAQTEAVRERTSADTEFLKTMAELKASSAARTLGKRGGKASGEARAAKKKAEARRRPGGCAVCNGDRANATRDMIRYHLGGHAGQPPRAAEGPGDGGGGVTSEQSGQS